MTLGEQEKAWLASDLANTVEGGITNPAGPVPDSLHRRAEGSQKESSSPAIVYPKQDSLPASQRNLPEFSFSLPPSPPVSWGALALSGGIGGVILIVACSHRWKPLLPHTAGAGPFPFMDRFMALAENGITAALLLYAASLLWRLVHASVRTLRTRNVEWSLKGNGEEVILLSARGVHPLSEDRFPRASISGVRAMAADGSKEEGKMGIFLLIGTEAVRKIGCGDIIAAADFTRKVNAALGIPSSRAAHSSPPASRSWVQSQSGVPSIS